MLAAQAIPDICKSLGIESSLPKEILPVGVGNDRRDVIENERARLLRELLTRYNVGWWSIFDASDIGREREMIASRFVTTNSEVLDLGSGRGFFTFACARRSKQVTSTDFMDGDARKGWWADFLAGTSLLGVSERVFGVRASAGAIPTREGSFDIAACVHAIRNFEGAIQIKNAIKEAYWVLKPGGTLVMAESEIGSRHSAYTAFYNIRVKLGWEFELPTSAELEEWFREAGVGDVRTELMETPLDYAPVRFPTSLIPEEKRRLLRDYQEALGLMELGKVESPPVMIISGRKAK